MTFLIEIEKTILRFIWNYKGHQKAKTILRKNKTEGNTLPNFKIYYKLIVSIIA